MRGGRASCWIAMALLLALPAFVALAQSSRDTERKLERVNRELKAVAAERRKLEGQRRAYAVTQTGALWGSQRIVDELPSRKDR